MKITKVIREYMEEVLNAKRNEANKKACADYDARRKACIEEIEALRESLREPVENILRKYSMDTEYIRGFYPKSMFDEVWHMHDSSIQNQTEFSDIREKERNRMETQKQAMRDIELEMALGGDKAKFMEMLSNVVIE
nr:MAG TPA: hypothetical protein [Caudoviricetes sp.]